MTNISPLAFVNPEAKIGDNVTINAFAYIDRDVVIGDGCEIRPHVSILAGSRIGKNNRFYDGCIVSATPQDFRWKGENSYVEIGDDNIIREHVIINRSIYENQSTRIGHHNFIMAQSHVAHDSEIGNHIVIGNSVKIAGSCKIDDNSILSSAALLHERCEIGRWVLIKGGCRVNSHVPPFAIMAHNPISYYGVNSFILKKWNFSDDVIDEIAKCYRHIYQTGTSMYNAIRRIEADIEPSRERDEILSFVRNHNMKLAGLNDETRH